MLGKIRECNASLKEYILDFDKRIKDVLSSYHDAIERMCEIPGIQNCVCEDLVAEIGLDMSNFPTSAHLCSWAGMCPGNNESAGKKKSGRTNHGDKQVKETLVEAAWAASRAKGTFFMERFNRLAPRKGSKKALIAVGHSLLKCIHYVLSTGGRYKELGDNYVPNKKEQKRKEYLKKELQKLGYSVKLSKED